MIYSTASLPPDTEIGDMQEVVPNECEQLLPIPTWRFIGLSTIHTPYYYDY